MKFLKSGLQKLAGIKNWFLTQSLLKKGVIFVFIIAVLWFGKSFFFKGSQAQAQYQTVVAEKGTLIESVTVSGSVTSANSASVTTQISGVVDEVYVANGEYVEAGTAIARVSLDQSSLQKQAAAYASYLSAANSVKTAEQNKLSADVLMWSASQSVLDSQNAVNAKNNNNTNASTKTEYTDLEKQSIDSSLVQAQKSFAANEKKYLEADSSITAAKAQLSSSWLSYQQTLPEILAPISGTLSDFSLQKGTIIASSTNSSSTDSSNSNASSKVASVKTEGMPTVSVNLTEIDVPKVSLGNKATITFDAFPGKTFTGKVVGLDTTGSVTSGVTTYPATISLDLPPENLYTNMSASASIITNTKDNVVLIPSAAVQTVNEESTVRVMKNNVLQTVSVETGLSNDTQTEIISGISEGDIVVTGQTITGGTSSTQTTSPFSGTRGGFGGGNAVQIRRQ